MASAVERAIFLRRFDIIGTIIIITWLLSPLGGQSSLRILDVTTKLITSQGQIYYFNTTSVSDEYSTFSTGDDYSSFLVSALLDASLMQSDRVLNSPVDQWNNVKIPRLDELSPFTHAAPENPWISVNQTAHKAWSSLTGLMIQQLPVDGISTFTLESSYLDLLCPNSIHIDEGSSPREPYREVFKPGLSFHNASWPFADPVHRAHANSSSSFFMDSISLEYSFESSPNLDYIKKPLNLLYASNLGVNNFMNLYNCSMGIARVESDIVCHGSSCTTNRMRRSEIYTKSPFTMPFSPTTYENLLLFLPFAMGVPHVGTVSAIDQYLLGSDEPLAAGFIPIASDFSGVTGQVFSERLMTILNTVWQASMATSSIPLGATANYSAEEYQEAFFPSASRTTTITQEVPVYAANYLFVAILLVIALILQLCAIAGLILKFTATAPDILGYISTMAMENPHVNVPPGGNTLDGLERARHLQEVKVQLADVNWEQVEGHLAFRSVDNEIDFAKGKLSKKRLYV